MFLYTEKSTFATAGPVMILRPALPNCPAGGCTKAQVLNQLPGSSTESGASPPFEMVAWQAGLGFAITGPGRYGLAIKSGRYELPNAAMADRKSTRLNSSHLGISYAVFCLKKK